MAGRTHKKHTRVYIGGYDFSGYANEIGPLIWEFDTPGMTCFTDNIQSGLPNHTRITPSGMKGVFDNTETSGLHVVIADGTLEGTAHNMTVVLGDRAAPDEGDPCFCGEFLLDDYKGQTGEGMLAATMTFGLWDASSLIGYSKPWGVLLHANAAATAANTGSADHDNGAATAAGGWLIYHVLAGDGTATISIDDSANGTDWTALTNATSGEVDCSSVSSGIVALTATADVRQYLRWQISLNTATTVTFVLAFIRG